MNAHAVSRIHTLKERMLSEPRYASIEQAKIITETYQQHEDEPRVLQRAYALQAALARIEIRIEPEELIVGNRTAGVRAGVVFPESGSNWVNREFETLPTRAQDRFHVREEDIKYFREVIYPYWSGKSLEDVLQNTYGAKMSAIGKVAKINQTDHAQGHICPDVKLWLDRGPSGLCTDAKQRALNSDGHQKDFYEAIAIVMEASCSFMRRYAALAREIAEQDSVHGKTLEQVAAVCDAISTRSPQTFHEALQSTWFLFVILQMESNASSFSPGRLDRILWPYYEADENGGRIDEDAALELIECLWLKFNQIVYMRNAGSAKYFAGFPIGFNVMIGGQDRNGNDVQNKLSFLFLQAQEDLGLPQPNLSVRLHEGTKDNLLKKAIRVVSKGSGMPQFFNDKSLIPALEALGISEGDAMDYAVVGCVEVTTQGNNLGWSDAAMFNLNKALELT